jgi:hypothetical protein
LKRNISVLGVVLATQIEYKCAFFMKKFLIPAVVIAAIILLYEQSQDAPNVYISAASIVVFMFFLFKLNARIPHKDNNTNDSDNVQ